MCRTRNRGPLIFTVATSATCHLPPATCHLSLPPRVLCTAELVQAELLPAARPLLRGAAPGLRHTQLGAPLAGASALKSAGQRSVKQKKYDRHLLARGVCAIPPRNVELFTLVTHLALSDHAHSHRTCGRHQTRRKLRKGPPSTRRTEGRPKEPANGPPASPTPPHKPQPQNANASRSHGGCGDFCQQLRFHHQVALHYVRRTTRRNPEA